MYSVILLPIVLLLSHVTAFTIPDGVCSFDVNAFTGGWYELASSYLVGTTIEAGCSCPVAYYTTNVTNANVLDITNSCIRNGRYYSVQGNAFPAPQGRPGGNLRVELSGSQSNDTLPNYIILKQWFTPPSNGSSTDQTLNNAPQFALVGGSNQNMWWFISRTPNFDTDIWYNANYVLQGNEYNITGFTVPSQTCQFLGGHGPNLIPPPGPFTRRHK